MDSNELLIQFCQNNNLREIKKVFNSSDAPNVNYLFAYVYRKSCLAGHENILDQHL